MKTTTTTKIEEILSDRAGPIRATYTATDSSVQAELRLACRWTIQVQVDHLHGPKNLRGDYPQPQIWHDFGALECSIIGNTEFEGKGRITLAANARTKAGPAARAQAETKFETDCGKAFLAEHRKITRRLGKIRGTVAKLQAQQKALPPQMRAVNAAYLAELKTAKAEQSERNAEALKSGRFWEADQNALKGYFHPPFDKNFLADVSERWRAALFVECESVSWKNNYGGWGHKLSGTGRGYLCGIDDNGDEWGHEVRGLYQSSDFYGNTALTGTAEQAMSHLFGVAKTKLAPCERQGDLLFCREEIPGEHVVCGLCNRPLAPSIATGKSICEYCWNWEGEIKTLPAVELHSQTTPWVIRESHAVSSPSLQRNGQYFRADDEITVTHTSHAPVVLAAGSYRLYELLVADAD